MPNPNLKIGILVLLVGIILISAFIYESLFINSGWSDVEISQQHPQFEVGAPTDVLGVEDSISETGRITTLIMQRGEKYYVVVIDLDNKILKSIDVLPEVKHHIVRGLHRPPPLPPFEISDNEAPKVKAEPSAVVVGLEENISKTKRITALKMQRGEKYYVVVIDLDNKILKSIDVLPVIKTEINETIVPKMPKIEVNVSFLNGSVKQNVMMIKSLTVFNEGSETLNVEILPPDFMRVIETSYFSISGKSFSKNSNKYTVKFYIDTSQTGEMIGNITIKSNDPNRSEIKIPVNFTIIPHTEKELKAISIANETDEVKELQKMYSSYLSRSCFEATIPYFSLVMHYEVKEVSPETLVVEYRVIMCEYISMSMYRYDIDSSMVRITINSTSWKIIEKYPKTKYFKNMTYCESDGDCKLRLCPPECANFIHLPMLDILDLPRSACRWAYGCKCVNNTCTALDFEFDYTEYAVREKDYSICENMDSMDRNKCIKKVAIATRSIPVCDKIEGDLKHVCLAVINKNETFCEYILLVHEQTRDFCYFEVAIAKKDPVVCNKIIENTQRTRCFKEIAILKKDAKLCDKIRVIDDYDNYHKVSCLATVKQNSLLCYVLPEGWMREDCIREAS